MKRGGDAITAAHAEHMAGAAPPGRRLQSLSAQLAPAPAAANRPPPPGTRIRVTVAPQEASTVSMKQAPGALHGRVELMSEATGEVLSSMMILEQQVRLGCARFASGRVSHSWQYYLLVDCHMCSGCVTLHTQSPSLSGDTRPISRGAAA